MKYHLKTISEITKGSLIGCNNLTDNILFDSRDTNLNNHSLFVAIHTSSRNGHNYIADMINCGVKSFIIEHQFILEAKKIYSVNQSIGFVVVENSITAIQSLAQEYRSRLTMPLIAIVGSNGKTITKEWIIQISENKNLFRSPKSFNSQLGVAISILMVRGDENYAIIEAGISKVHEMSRLESMIKPDGVIFTNINSAHLENFKNLEQLLNEKMAILKSAKFVIYNNDNTLINNYINKNYPSIDKFTWGEKGDIITYYKKDSFSLKYKNITYQANPTYTDYGSYENMVSAISLIAQMDGNIEYAIQAIDKLESVDMRLQLISGINNCRIINDVYSNDIHSLTIALNYLKNIASDQKHILILSDFIESNANIYPQVVELLNKFNIDKIYSIGLTIGKGLQGVNASHNNFRTTDEFCRKLSRKEFVNRAVLIKGSRRFSFEKIITILQEKAHSTELNIDLEILIQNYKILTSTLSENTKSVAMVKALGYGSGGYEIAASLCEAGVDYLAVAYLDEGINLREKGITKPIIILNSTSNDFEQIVQYRLQPEMYSHELLISFIDYCSNQKIENYPIHIKLDTGMNRLGFKGSEIDNLSTTLLSCKEVTITSIFSHLSSADDPTKDDITNAQISLFDSLSQKIIDSLALKGVLRHICNSVASARFPDAHFDMVRFGIALYGIGQTNEIKNISSLHSTIIQIKNIIKGESIGYNQQSIAERDTKIAIVGIGYADGFNRKLSCGKWSMKIDGKHAPTIGNISMDNCAIDITGLEVKVGDRVTIFDSTQEIIKMSEIVETIPYEILTSISNRIKRRYFR